MVERVNNLVRLPAVRLCAIALFLGVSIRFSSMEACSYIRTGCLLSPPDHMAANVLDECQICRADTCLLSSSRLVSSFASTLRAYRPICSTIGTALARIIPFISSNLSPCFRAAKPLPSRLLAKLPLSANENRLPLLSAIGISTFLTIVWICSNETLNLLCLFGIGYLWVSYSLKYRPQSESNRVQPNPLSLRKLLHK